ncbi:MAG: glycosyltransferase, partial [Hyphomicrobiaceae bacterium]|nr:glycosyltransferase [Hyphomicrobiaceae bacterium]
MSKPVIMIAAGGTGGHLFPAFALSEEFGRRGHLVDLVTDMRGDKYGTGFPARTVHQVPSATLRSKTPWGAAQMAFTLLRGIVRARALLREVKPSVIIGFGGYPTVPPLIAASMLNIPVVLHEQNAVMGRANRLLVRFATAIGLTFEKTKYLREAHRAKA